MSQETLQALCFLPPFSVHNHTLQRNVLDACYLVVSQQNLNLPLGKTKQSFKETSHKQGRKGWLMGAGVGLVGCLHSHRTTERSLPWRAVFGGELQCA